MEKIHCITFQTIGRGGNLKYDFQINMETFEVKQETWFEAREQSGDGQRNAIADMEIKTVLAIGASCQDVVKVNRNMNLKINIVAMMIENGIDAKDEFSQILVGATVLEIVSAKSQNQALSYFASELTTACASALAAKLFM